MVQAVPFQAQNYLIMDIGGGSVEFIIANQKEILWAESFPVGVAVLHKLFKHSEPILPEEVYAIRRFLQRRLHLLYDALEKYPTTVLVGASGTFDVLEYVLAKEQNYPNHAFVKVEDFYPLYYQLINSTLEERLAMKDIPDTRADMIIVAVILIDVILEKAQIQQIIVSNYAMKEGVLAELMDDECSSNTEMTS